MDGRHVIADCRDDRCCPEARSRPQRLCFSVALCAAVLVLSFVGVSGQGVGNVASNPLSGRWFYGTVSWRLVSGSETSDTLTVEITTESAWRRSDPSIVVYGTKDAVSSPGQSFIIGATDGVDTIFNFGDGSNLTTFNVEVVAVDTAQDIIVGRTVLRHAYTKKTVYNASLTTCCKFGGHQNANGKVYIDTRVDLTVVNSVFRSVGSPIIQTLPAIMLNPGPRLQTFAVPAVSQRGFNSSSPLKWSAAPLSYYAQGSFPPNSYGSFSVPPTGQSPVDANTGLVTIDTLCLSTKTCQNVNLVLIVSEGAASSSIDFTVFMNTQDSFTAAQLGLTLIAPPAPHPLNSRRATAIGDMPPVISYVGFELVLTFQGPSISGRTLSFRFSTLPAGARLGPLAGGRQSVLWVPAPGDVGRRFVCASAVQVAAAQPPPFQQSTPLCFNVEIQPNPPPEFTQPSFRQANIYLNQRFQMRVSAGSDNPFSAVRVAPSGPLPPGASVTAAAGGAALDLVWRPASPLGGWAQPVCFEANASAGAAPAGGAAPPADGRLRAVLCVDLAVVPCAWQVGPAQSLDDVAAVYGTNFLQLWSLNGNLLSPDDPIAPGAVLRVGHFYTVRATDNLQYLSVQFATTRDTLSVLNYGKIGAGLGPKDPLTDLAGTAICILPNSCYTRPTVASIAAAAAADAAPPSA